MSWSGAVIGRWRPEARRLELTDRVGHVAAELSFVLPGRDVTAEQADEDEVLVLASNALLVRLRITTLGVGQSVHLTIDNRTAEPVDLSGVELDLDAGPQHVGWSWASGPHAAIAAFGAVGGRPGVLVRLRAGYARRADFAPAYEHPPTSRALPPSPTETGSGGASLRLGSGPLAAYGRYTCTLEITREVDLPTFETALPRWLPATVVDADDVVDFGEPDLALVAERDVQVADTESGVVLTAQPGHHLVSVHGPRGVDHLPLTWSPSEDELLTGLVGSVVRGRPSRAAEAEGLVVAEALARGVADEDALDWAESVDWLDRGSLLGDATAGVLAALTGERPAFGEVWRQLERREPVAGFGLVVVRLGAAAFAAFGAPPRTDLLLAGAGTDTDTAVELALLRSGDAAWWADELDGYRLALGADLPGRPLGLAGVRAAYLASILRLTPEGWVGRPAAMEAVAKTERLLRADYVPSATVAGAARGLLPLDAFAWLLLGRLGN